MFPDSDIAQQLSMGCTKSLCVINHGLAPFYKSQLTDDLEKSDIHVFSFDEGLNDVTQTSEIDLYVRYWDMNASQVKSRYYGSSFLGHATHKDLLKHFGEITKNLSPSKLYHISMDGPNVNLKSLKEFSKLRAGDSVHSLADISTCSLHSVHGSMKTGEITSKWGLKKIVKSAYTIMHDSPARREDYVSVSGSKLYPLSFCATQYGFVFEFFL